MNITLSPRLQCCASHISGNRRVADIGCDHGYLGIHLLQSGSACAVIAADVNEGPLQSAMRNAEKYGVREQMRFYLSDGARNIPRDFDTLVCAGMGGDTIIHILENAPWLRSEQYTLVLQCQSKSPALRQYLSDTGWHIFRENIVRDGKFLYSVLSARYDPQAPRLTPGQCCISPAMLEAADPCLGEYYSRIADGLRLAVTHQGDPQKKQILAELESDPNLDQLRRSLL